jgi:hypothetical protein
MAREATQYSAAEAKAIVLKEIRKGSTIVAATAKAERVDKTYEYWMKTDAAFKRSVEDIRKMHQGAPRPTVPDFPKFAKDYLGLQLFNHQLQWVDLIEGQEPRNLHMSQRYERGWMTRKKLYVCNTPPDHAKTHTLSISYVTWRILKNPNLRVLIISKTQDLAKDILSAVKDRLDSRTPMFEKLKEDFSPPEGFEGHSGEWRQDRIRLSVDVLTSGEKDPTVRAAGMGQQIYGKRADLIIMDDCVDLGNVHNFEQQIKWTQKEVQSRLVVGGTLLIIGTRMASQDFYSEITKPERYPARGASPYTYLSQPAVLEMAPDPDEWVTLWPWSNMPPENLDELDYEVVQNEDGLWPRFPGSYMNELKDSLNDPNAWSMTYQQEQVSENNTFTLDMLTGCTNLLRIPGPLVEGQRGHRPGGMQGLFVVGGLDPAPENYTAIVILGIDRQTTRRYVLDVWTMRTAPPRTVRETVQSMTQRYGVMEWRIEENGLNKYISQDEEMVRWLRGRGVAVQGHITNKNKWDPMYGVASMANLFLGHEHAGGALIELPSPRGHVGVSTLRDELLSWFPTPSQAKMPKQDCVMALWFAELRARTICDQWDHVTHLESDMLSPMDREEQMSVDLDAFLAQESGGGGPSYMMVEDWMRTRGSGDPSSSWTPGSFW